MVEHNKNWTEEEFKALVVDAILQKRTEEAIRMLSDWYHIEAPKVRIGPVKGKTSKIHAAYLHSKRVIVATSRDAFFNPFIMLHEWYHHLRYFGGKHRGTERHADQYALDFLESYRKHLSIDQEKSETTLRSRRSKDQVDSQST